MSALLKGVGQFGPKFQVKGVVPTNRVVKKIKFGIQNIQYIVIWLVLTSCHVHSLRWQTKLLKQSTSVITIN